MKSKFILIVAIFLVQIAARSQQPGKPAISYDTDYLSEEFRLPGGIPGNNVNCIVEGPYGFLWFGTHAGLIRYDGYEFVTYGPAEGDTLGETSSLTFPYVENLYWDRFNKLWVSTYGGGLFRFDPETETFKHFKANPDDPTAIPHQQVMCATEDANGELWFGTAKGLCRFDRKTEKFTSFFADPADPKSLRHDQVHNLYVDKQGVLWIATGQVLWNPTPGGLSRYHPETNSFSNYGYSGSEPYLGAVRPMLEDSRGNFWIGTTDGLFKMDRQAGTFEKMPFNPHALHPPGSMHMEKVTVHAIYEDRAGGLWVGIIGVSDYASHLSRFDMEAKTTEYFRIPTSCWQVLESSDGTVWAAGAGVGGKAWKLKPKTLEFDLQRGGDIKAAFPKSQLFKDLKVEPSYNLDGPYEMTIDPATGVFWVQYFLVNYATNPTQTGLPVLANYDPKIDRYAFYPLPGLNRDFADRSLPGNWYNPAGMAVDKHGRIWGTYGHEDIGIYSFDPKTGAIRHFTHDPQDANSLSSNFVVSMMMDSRGEIWASTHWAGINRLDPETGKIKHYTRFDIEGKTSTSGAKAVAYTLLEDKEGKIWAGGDFSDGVDAFAVIIDPVTDSIKDFPLPEAFSSTSIRYITQDPEGRWVDFVLFQRGLCTYVVDENRFSFSNTGNGNLPFDNIASAQYDKKGNYWVAARQTSDFVFWPASATSASEKYLFKNSTNLSSRSRQVVVGPGNGHLYFLNDEGWAEIDPENLDIRSPANASSTRVVNLYVMGEKQSPQKGGILSKPLWMLDEITLPNDAETFGFRFTDFNFRDANTTYQYRLYPYETDWRKTDQEPVANYYKIPHGEYRFQVRAIQVSGQLSEQQAELKVTILPPWWKTWWAYTIYGLLLLTGIYFFDRFQRRRIIQQERRRALEKEAAQKREIEKAYADLKAAQTQLIQSEKLASLGELTAGIAHEIQNPLNFVNNFSELSVDLAKELAEELEKVDMPEKDRDYIGGILGDLTQNQQKINHHGKRAASIVTGMLQHARSSTGKKEPTDLNALADEFLRLAYHGLRAKDPNFNAAIGTGFDPSVGKVELIPQDMGRVLLNLINNAFYAVSQKAKQGLEGYEPTVTVSTQKTDGQIVIKIQDNGTGIPDSVQAKIFQPFFTTKPAGEGTGLGLSLAYDIVVKGHGGTMEVESAEGEGTAFVIQLPFGKP
ncbi:MAG: GHKL domain-containing protein [Saprospirales bacterium]|nr:GHKL domain-containing protein [Saprospirales bacterium]